ncbi:MAG TPA: hypothetical protein VLB85_04145 [Acidimicrobiia bacterium]|nr:hypothetical protein [Acidimicrobiia bacterium]
MTLEERIVRELKAERRLVPAATPAEMPTMPSRLPRYLGLAAALAAVVLGGLWLVNLRSSSLDDLVAAADADGEITIDGEVTLPVASEPGGIDVRGSRLPLLIGAPAPQLEADIDIGGLEQPLVLAQPKWDQSTWAGEVPLVYIGDRSGRSVFVHTNGTIGFLDRLLAAGDIGDHICMTIGDTTAPVGGAGFCASAASSHGGTLHDNAAGAPAEGWWATWIDVPDGTAVVTMSIAGEATAWQRPVGQTAFFDGMEPPTGLVEMTAIGVGGEELANQTLLVEVFISTPTTTSTAAP